MYWYIVYSLYSGNLAWKARAELPAKSVVKSEDAQTDSAEYLGLRGQKELFPKAGPSSKQLKFKICFKIQLRVFFQKNCSARCLMTPCWERMFIFLGGGRPYGGFLTGWISGLRPVGWSSIRTTAGSCTLATTAPSNTTGLGQSD